MTKELTEQYVPGRTKVKVFHYAQGANGGRVIEEFHRGQVVSRTATMVRVFDPAKKSSDASPYTAELFAIRSPEVWCEIVSQQESGREFPIPTLFR